MKPTTRAARRGLAALAVTAAAVAIPTTALAASGSPAKPAGAARSAVAAVPPRCGTGALTAWLGIPGDAFAGGVNYQLELSNTSNHACTLFGFPGVSALGPGGHQLGSAAGRDHADPNRLVTLGRGATAHAVLTITDVANFPSSSCGQATATALRVYPPGSTRSLEVPFTFRACGKSGPVYLHIRTTVGGAGIPGFSG
ncbi:MAG: hypothetical protein QOG05_7085 [Streptosporangiaceae bacterium]|jgi:hypothetical protein|nr:hypothetical protein [Streptosporangiaceae bacterium]